VSIMLPGKKIWKRGFAMYIRSAEGKWH